MVDSIFFDQKHYQKFSDGRMTNRPRIICWIKLYPLGKETKVQVKLPQRVATKYLTVKLISPKIWIEGHCNVDVKTVSVTGGQIWLTPGEIKKR